MEISEPLEESSSGNAEKKTFRLEMRLRGKKAGRYFTLLWNGYTKVNY